MASNKSNSSTNSNSSTSSSSGNGSQLKFVEEIDPNELKYCEVVGRGAFGTVSKADWRGNIVAVKQIETENEKRAFVQELKQLSRVSHPNIVKLYGASTRYPVCLVMEFAECGSLYHLLHSADKSHIDYTAAHCVSWCLQTALGVAYLHNMKPKPIIHRDLKPPNLLLVKEGLVVKLCDFGTAADYQTHMTNNKGSAAWMAPEVFEGNRYSEKCDVFSWGIVLWECFSRQKPFDDIAGNPFRIMWAVHSGTRPPLLQNMPEPIETLMTRCWSKNPAERPSMDEVVRIMELLMPVYKDHVAPIRFGSFFIEDDDDDDGVEEGASDNNLKLTITDLPSPGNRSSAEPVTPNRQISQRDTEVVSVEPLEQDVPPIPVIESGRASSRSSLTSSTGMDRDNSHTSICTPWQFPMEQPDGYSPTANVSDSQKRHSADPAQLLPLMEDLRFYPTVQSTHKKGHRRNNSYGNPAIKLDITSQGYSMPPYNKMSTSVSYTGDLRGGTMLDPSAHPPLGQTRSFSHEQASMPPPLSSQSTPSPSFSQLDDNLKPLQPYPNSQESLVVYYEHVDLAERYTELKNNVSKAHQRMEELKNKVQAERRKKDRNRQLVDEFLRLSDENEENLRWKAELEGQVRQERQRIAGVTSGAF